MDTTNYIALNRQLVLQRQMTVTAGNIANMNTTGFRAEQMVFEELLQPAGEAGKLSYVQDLGLLRDGAPGPITETGNPFDLAIAGPGFFSVQTDQGVRHTRNGHFQVNAFGEVETSEGHLLLDDGGAPIAVPPDVTDITVAADGTISDGETVIGRIQLVAFDDERLLEREGGSLYRSEQPGTPVDGDIIQGALEGSNVQPILEMRRMMETTRAFQNTQKLLETQHDMTRRAVEETLSTSG